MNKKIGYARVSTTDRRLKLVTLRNIKMACTGTP